MKQEQCLDRELYRKIKAMKREEMEKTLKNMYQLGYDAALKEGVVELDTNKLREKISKIKGIGEARLNEIMTIIENAVAGENDNADEDE